MSGWQAWPPPTREQVEAALRPALPTVPRPYHQFLRAPRHRWWKPIVALVLAGSAWFVGMLVLGPVGFLLDGRAADLQSGNPEQLLRLTPWVFLANNVALALGIPIVFLTQWAVWGQRPRWLSSVEGRFRWGWFARCLAWAFPLLAVLVVLSSLVVPADDVRWRDDSLLMLVGILLTTPWQAAGEEYAMRGLQSRAVAAWFAHPLVGWAVSTVAASVTFMLLHGADDPWLNLFYFSFGVVTSFVVWRTGGLEAACAIHIANNLSGMALLPFIDFSDLLDRSDGTGDASALLQLGVVTVLAGLLVWQARRHGIVTRAAPGAAEVDRAHAALLGATGPGGPPGVAASGGPSTPFR